METRGKVVFVVDDERLIALTLCAILIQHGYRALWFSDPLLALAEMEAGRPEVVITDYEMPFMSGELLVFSMYRIDPRCRFLIFSSHSGTRRRRPVRGSPCPHVDELAKPVAINHLMESVASVFAGVEV